ncbi:hypothetical protein BD410DRAFT_793173 [Rickenella mellea]|uniref:Uncharacterized protein n=1 Tax=Rickenella mellea TaxID=50990 RepID=A0A4Y7PUC8_9AGAM|nr:hypothetical protein BD410DRAFT_793173 [Rickenella mellea]
MLLIGAFTVNLVLALSACAMPTLVQILGTMKQFQKDWTFPRVTEIGASINYTLFDPDVIGRVDITNTFYGNELNTEYLFGAFSSFGTSKTTSLIGVPLNSTISELVIQGDTVSLSLIAMFNWTVKIVPVQVNFFFKFDDEGKVTQYDAQLVHSSWLFQTVLPGFIPILAKELGLPVTTNPFILVAKRAAMDICAEHDQFCTGENLQYKSTEECMNFIETAIPFGDYWQAGQNSGICRYLHKAMVSRRPSVHCPHIGPSGGDMCIDRDYEETVTKNPFKKPFIGMPEGIAIPDSLQPTHPVSFACQGDCHLKMKV